MELRHLRSFCALAEHGAFREAGRRLHVSQAAISEQNCRSRTQNEGPILRDFLRLVRENNTVFNAPTATKLPLSCPATCTQTQMSKLG
jgi:hypothetical protein